MKKFVLGLVCGLVISFAAGSYASGVWSKIDVLENDVTIYANGVKVDVPNFIYEGRTYAPLRAVLEQMECNVNYYEYHDYKENVDKKEVFAHNRFNISEDKKVVSYAKTIDDYIDKNYDVYELFAHAVNGEWKHINGGN